MSQDVSSGFAGAADAATRKILFAQHLQAAKGVLHLGAHIGQEAAFYAQHMKPVVWVEALPPIHASLEKNIQPYPDQRALCALLGDVDGAQKRFYISNNQQGVSSSMFQFGEHGSGAKSLWPDLNLAMVGHITLAATRLDTLLRANAVNPADFNFWMVDLQGAELIALHGAGVLIGACQAMFIETSTVDVYRGGVLWLELSQWLQVRGFVPLWQPAAGHDDVLFVRK